MRIASLISSATEMLFGLGLADQIVAVSHECDWPPPANEKPRATFTNIAADAPSGLIDRQVKELIAAGKTLYEVDLDLLVELKPDLIVTQAQCDVCAVRYDDVVAAIASEPSLRGTKIHALNPQGLDDVLQDIRRLGAATERSAEADAYVKSLEARIAVVRERTGLVPAENRPLTACIEWIDPLMIAGNWTPELVELAGGRQVWATAGAHSTYTAWEAVRAADPEVIVVMPCGFGLQRSIREATTLRDLPGWSELWAVLEGRVFAVDGNALFNRSGPRLVDSLELLAQLVHPESFDDPPDPTYCRSL
ncbi:MAG: cobalamin-binding protein [Planctomycetales bacterium]|nr:cobalamin-binding protein [Planctomycetales bacterium]MBN8625414.1 cobalamin-binding protein [Planctomycetota bacterium]